MAGQPPGATRSAKPGDIVPAGSWSTRTDVVLGRLATQRRVAPARQAPRPLHAARRHRRLRRRRERREGAAHRPQARAEDLLPPHRLGGRLALDHGREDPGGQAPRARDRAGRARDAAEEHPRPEAAPQAQGLRRPRRTRTRPSSRRSFALPEPRAALLRRRSSTATGKRKTAVARVRMKLGSGQILVNGRTPRGVLPARDARSSQARQPLEAANVAGTFDVHANLVAAAASPGRRARSATASRAPSRRPTRRSAPC